MVNIGAVITARMASTRFPGKVIAPLFGEPMLGQIIKRVRKVVDIVGVATTTSPEDDEIEYVCKDYGALVYRGSTWDVFHRRWYSARDFGLTVAFDISGDCPYIDPDLMALLKTAILTSPGYDMYCHPPFYRDIGETLCCARALTYYEKIESLYLTLSEDLRIAAEGSYGALLEEHYGLDVNGVGFEQKYTRVLTIPTHLNRMNTPMKLSIDYPLELDVANLICSHLGNIPSSIEQIMEAYKSVRVPATLARQVLQ